MAEFDASAAIWSSGDNPSVCHRQPPAEAEVMTRSDLDYCGVPVPDGGESALRLIGSSRGSRTIYFVIFAAGLNLWLWNGV